MIRTIRHKGLKRIHEDDDPRGLIAEHADKLRDILSTLHAAPTVAHAAHSIERSKSMKCHLAVILAGSLLAAAAGATQESPRLVGLMDLMANRQQYDGTVVTVRAFLLVLGGHHDIASYFLCLNKEDAENQLGNDIWVSPSAQMQSDREKFDRMYVEVTGTIRVVRAANGAYTVGIKDIRTCKVWSDPSRPNLPKAEAADRAAVHR
jgi:hypothetical protein